MRLGTCEYVIPNDVCIMYIERAVSFAAHMLISISFKRSVKVDRLTHICMLDGGVEYMLVFRTNGAFSPFYSLFGLVGG